MPVTGDGRHLVEEDTLVRLNDERALRGLPALRNDPGLAAAAREWATVMSESGYQHSPVERLRLLMQSNDAGAVGENIHAPERQCGAGPSCDSDPAQPTSGVLAVDWMHSAEHRDNVTDRRWDRAGVGVVCASDGRLWAVVLFGAPRGPESAVTNMGSSPAPVAHEENAGFMCNGQYRAHNPLWRHPPSS